MRRNYAAGPLISVSSIVPPEDGGTGADNLDDARQNLLLEDAGQIGNAGGAIPLDGNGQIPPEFFNVETLTSVDVKGPLSLNANEVGTFEITNYDSRADYLVGATVGAASRIGKLIYYKAPPQGGQGGFFVNGVLFEIEVAGQNRPPNAPTILSPASGTEQNTSRVTVLTSAFSSPYVDDEHYSSDYQVALDAGFTQILASLNNGRNNLTGWQFDISTPGQVVYIRARHRGIYGTPSAWSPVVTFKRAEEERPQTPLLESPSGDVQTPTDSYTLQTNEFVGSAAGDAHAKTIFQVSTDPAFDPGVTQTYEVGPGLYSRQLTNLVTDRKLYVRAAHVGTEGWTSNWSTVSTLTYKYLSPIPVRPTLELPASATLNTKPTIFQASAYQNARPAETLQNMDFQIAKDAAFTTDVQNVTSPNNRVEYYNIEASTVYYVRVRYRSLNNHVSEWSVVRQFTSAASFAPAGETALVRGSNQAGSKFGVPLAFNAVNQRLFAAERCQFPSTTPQGAVLGLQIFRDQSGTWVRDTISPVTGSEPPAGEYDNLFYPAFDISQNGDRLVTFLFRSTAPGATGTLYPVVLERTENVWRYRILTTYGISHSLSTSFANFFVGMNAEGDQIGFYMGGTMKILNRNANGTAWALGREVNLSGSEMNPAGTDQRGLGRLNLNSNRFNLNNKILNIEGAAPVLVREITTEAVDSVAQKGPLVWLKHKTTGAMRLLNTLTNQIEPLVLSQPSWACVGSGFSFNGEQAYLIQKDPNLTETYLLVTLTLNQGTWSQSGYRLVRKPHGPVTGAAAPSLRFYSVSNAATETATDAGVIAVN